MVSILSKISFMLLVVWLILIAPLFKVFPSLIRRFVFQPNLLLPPNPDYQSPVKYGFNGGRNFYVTTGDGAKIGVWHLLPEMLEGRTDNVNINEMSEEEKKNYYKKLFADATVFLYVHGSTGSRVLNSHITTYRVLSGQNYHVIAFDYRGYGDSTLKPKTETDLITDTLAVYNWIKENSENARVFVWGHSLGTGVASHFVLEEVSKGEQIRGIVLESPFSNLAEVVRTKPIMQTLSVLPWFESCFIDPLNRFDLSFHSDIHLTKISTPVIILHAKDDPNVPYIIGLKLYEKVAASRADPSTVQMISYDADRGYGHFNIPTDPELGQTIRQFVEKYQDTTTVGPSYKSRQQSQRG